MKTALLVLFIFYFSLQFVNSFASWIKSKSNKEYCWRFVDTLSAAALMFAFIKLVGVLS